MYNDSNNTNDTVWLPDMDNEQTNCEWIRIRRSLEREDFKKR